MKFKDLKVGDQFSLGGHLYIKIEPVRRVCKGEAVGGIFEAVGVEPNAGIFSTFGEETDITKMTKDRSQSNLEQNLSYFGI
tara:strand:+ start:363 stop:605 length:243 start_codon:yes stop_codon:yes gene_type:complete